MIYKCICNVSYETNYKLLSGRSLEVKTDLSLVDKIELGSAYESITG